MGAATYIGRVGGLAVALGVGTAIATGQGVATADDTNNSTAPNTSTDGSTSTDSTSTNPTTGPTTGASTIESTEPSNTTQTPRLQTTSTQTTTSSTTSTTVAEGVVVSAQTNTGTSSTTGSTEPTHKAEPTAEPSQTSTPTETAAPQPTQTTEPKAPTKSPDAQEVSTPPSASKSSNESGASLSVAKPSAKASAPKVQPFADPATNIRQPDKVAVFADARALAAAGPTNVSPVMAAQVTGSAVTEPAPPASPPDRLTAVANVVSSVINWVLNPLAGTSPTTPAQPPLMWGLLAFARREFENFFNTLGGRSAQNVSAPPQTTSLALDSTEMAGFAAAAAAVTANPPYLPFPRAQVSPSTQFVSWVTGDYIYDGHPTLANTSTRYSVWGTDVGTMWDNGIPDDPRTTDINEHQVLIAVGDTFSGPNSAGWRPNTIFRSSDSNLTDGITIADGQWFNGNWFGGAPLGPNSTTARPIILAQNLPAGLASGVTLIPTAGISLPTPGAEFGATQYLSFMSVKQWGSPGRWTTNYSAIAYSVDNGENWKVAPSSVRLNSPYGGNKNFQQAAFVLGDDGYVYSYGTPNGRQGAAYVSRVLPKDILDVSKYEYYSKGTTGWFSSTPAGWYKNDPGKATPVFGQEGGACGVANAGNTVSEMSVQYNKELNKYVVLYGDQSNNIVMRTSDTPQGTWSSAKVLMGQQNGGIYAPMMHPWSPSTQGTGTDLYWNLSLSSDYNVMLMRTDLTKV